MTVGIKKDKQLDTVALLMTQHSTTCGLATAIEANSHQASGSNCWLAGNIKDKGTFLNCVMNMPSAKPR